MKGSFIAPVVLTDVTHDMRIMNEEIFGPVLPVMKVRSEEEALSLANDSQFGLGASVWTKDRAKGERMAHQIESGMVWVNDHSRTAPASAPGVASRTRLWPSHSKFGFYEARTSSSSPGSRSTGTCGGSRTTASSRTRFAPRRMLYSRNGDRLTPARGFRPLVEVTRRTMRQGAWPAAAACRRTSDAVATPARSATASILRLHYPA